MRAFLANPALCRRAPRWSLPRICSWNALPRYHLRGDYAPRRGRRTTMRCCASPRRRDLPPRFPASIARRRRRKLEESAADTEVKVTTLEVRNENPPVLLQTRAIMDPLGELSPRSTSPVFPSCRCCRQARPTAHTSMPSASRPTESRPSSSGRIKAHSRPQRVRGRRVTAHRPRFPLRAHPELRQPEIDARPRHARAASIRRREIARRIAGRTAERGAAPARRRWRNTAPRSNCWCTTSPSCSSAASSATPAPRAPPYMAPIWPRLRAMHLNAVFAPVSWELIEPEEGVRLVARSTNSSVTRARTT